MLNEAYRQAMHTFLDAEEAYAFLERVQQFRWSLRELPVVSPFSFAIYASKIKESMMLEDPGAAIERIYREMYDRVEAVAQRSSNLVLLLVTAHLGSSMRTITITSVKQEGADLAIHPFRYRATLLLSFAL